MHYLARFTLLIALLTIVVTACKVPDIPTTTNYSFTNTFSEKLTLDFYTSRDDYNHNTSPAHYTIEPGATITVPFDIKKKYWIDWYTAGYTYNNWMDSARTSNMGGSEVPTPWPYLPIVLADVHYDVYAMNKDTSRSVLLNGNDDGSVWKIKVANSAPINGVHTFKLRKDFSCEYTYVDLPGNSTTKEVVYAIDVSYPNLTVYFYNSSTDISPFAAFSLDKSLLFHSRDTLTSAFTASGGIYPAIRQ